MAEGMKPQIHLKAFEKRYFKNPGLFVGKYLVKIRDMNSDNPGENILQKSRVIFWKNIW